MWPLICGLQLCESLPSLPLYVSTASCLGGNFSSVPCPTSGTRYATVRNLSNTTIHFRLNNKTSMDPIQSLMNDSHTLLPSPCMYEDTTHVQMHTHTPLLVSSNLQPRVPSGLYHTSGIKPDGLWEPHFRKQCRQQPCFYLSPTYGSNTSHYLHHTASDSHVVATPVSFNSHLSHACYMPSHDTLLDFITLIIFGNDYKL